MMSQPKINLLIVDDHPIILEGIHARLASQDTIKIIGEAVNGEEAIAMAKTLSPDVILMDISMPVMSGIDATKRLCAEMPDVRILVLTMHENKEYTLEIIRAGAKGYILKNSTSEELKDAIDTVYKGDAYFSNVISQMILNEYVKESGHVEGQKLTKLSPREVEVLSHIADGFSNKEIAAKLCVSMRTVETHRERIMRKLDIHSVAELTKYAISKGITKI